MKQIPKHKHQIREDRKAHAPYNFVPLPEKVVTVDGITTQDRYDHYTGYIECTLFTKSPLYTRSGMNPEAFRVWSKTPFEKLPEEQKDKRAQFFHVADARRPVIPGSSLRGMVRALVEIAGYGKPCWVTNEDLVFRSLSERFYRERLMQEDSSRHYTPLMQAGYIEQVGARWFIRPAKNISGTTFARIHHDRIPTSLGGWHTSKNAYQIWARLGSYDYQDVRGGRIQIKYTPVLEAKAASAPGYQEAVLTYSGAMDSKRREAVVFPPDAMADPIEIDEEMVRVYRGQISQEQKALLGEDGILRPHQPVFYQMKEGRLVFFGHLWLFRLPYPNSPLDLVPSALRRNTETDLAEAIFGFVPENAEDGRKPHAGRVFFSDAYPKADEANFWLSETPITPKILSGPKPTAFQHYLTQQEPDNRDRLDHYASPPPHETTLRGHKLYWHQDDVGLEEIQEADQETIREHSSQYTRIKPVRSGLSFIFRIYFENLRAFELGALLWVLALPNVEEKEYCQKLGMGKPLGLGTVSIEPYAYLSDRGEGQKHRYARLFTEGANKWHLAEKSVEADPFTQAFEEYVLARVDQEERNGETSLLGLPRIQMLLALLEWPGPERSATEYMTIEGFKKRPVLPDPLAVVAGHTVRPPVRQRDVAPPRESTTEIRTGVVKKWLDDKGYGFIVQDDGSEIFVHHTGVEGTGRKSLREGQRVSYVVGTGPNGRPQAQQVRMLKT